MNKQVHDIPPELIKLFDKAGGRMNGFQRNVTYATERAIRSAREALRLLLHLWLQQRGEAVQSKETLEHLLSVCRQADGGSEAAALADAVLAGCEDLHETPPRHPETYTREELLSEIRREAVPSEALCKLDKWVQKMFGEHLLVGEGDWIRQAYYGVAQIKKIQGCRAELELASPRTFGDDRPVLMSLLHGEIEKINPNEEAEKQTKRDAETFLFEAQPDRKASTLRQLTWWSQFMEPAEFTGRLPEMLAETKETFGYGDFWNAQDPSSIDWQPTEILQYPAMGYASAAFVLTKAQPDKQEIIACYPFYYLGTQVALELDKVHVWPDAAIAQLDCNWRGAVLSFFEVAFSRNRIHYRAGNEYEFILTGIVYGARPSTLEKMEVPEGALRESLRKGRLLAGYPAEDGDVNTIAFHGAAILVPASTGERDEYAFRGPIKSVKPITMLGASGWCVEVTVMRADDNSDFDLRIIVTHRSWQGDEPPRVGEDIEGTLWLQGRLWFIPRNTKRPE